jgi:hypothetical protein
MKPLGALLLMVLLAACNLTTRAVAPQPVVPPTLLVTAPFTTADPFATPSPLPLQPPPLTAAPTLAASGGNLCAVYTTYSGNDPANKLSLRAQPSVAATQLLKLPNRASVYLVPGSQEVEAEGYHWLNIVYIDESQNHYEGWTARDSYSKNGVRDLSIATLRTTGQQIAC